MSDSDPPTRPFISVSVRPATDGDQEKLARALSHLADEDPSLTVSTESLDGRVVLGGTSESQLESACDQVYREHQIELHMDEPKVIYLETIRRTSEAEGKYIRQTGGHGNYGHVKLRLEPAPRGSGYRFFDETKESQIPVGFIEPVTLGALEAAKRGILAGYEVVDLRVVLYDGSFHSEDSNEAAFKFAGSIAFKEAARKASPVVLEPVMSTEAEVPEKLLSNLVGYFNSLRGRIEGMESIDGWVTIRAIVPLAEILQSGANGGPVYPMHFAGYEPAPPSGWNRDDGAGITANKPEGPRNRGGSASAWPEAESE
jgi:elongation factor G